MKDKSPRKRTSKTTSSNAPAKKRTRAPRKNLSDAKPDISEKEPRVLSIDIGGSKVKMLVNGELKARKAPTGPEFTPLHLIDAVNELTADWEYDVISIGFPGLVGSNGPIAEPGNLGSGWMGFDFNVAFNKPVKILNDAAMQAVGSYEGGRMLFFGLGTGVGTTLIVDHSIIPLELGDLRWNAQRSLGEVLSKRQIRKIGIKKWRAAAQEILTCFLRAFIADYIVVGGGNAKLLKELPPGARLGHNQTAFLGGYRIWGVENYSAQNAQVSDIHGNWSLL